MDQIRSRAVVAVFMVLLAGLSAALWLLPDAALSYTERRPLAQFPTLDGEAVFRGELAGALETYLLDQFPGRETFRSLKARVSLLLRRDNNGLYLWRGGLYKQEYPLRADQLAYGARRVNALCTQYLQGMRVFYAVIPDKSCYVARDARQLHLDLSALRAQLREAIDPAVAEISLADCLTAEDYYRTDPHWRQDRLGSVLARLEEALDVSFSPAKPYDAAVFSPFYGAYYGQSALPVPPDEMVYLQSAATRAATVETLDTGAVAAVYTPEAYNGMDAYDLFLGGAAAVQVLTNPDNAGGRELILFRDSFASALAPLLLEGYGRITLVDLRYLDSRLLPELIDFADQDVLFLLSTLVWNNAAMLR